jgi:coproporphyrinogen III oxidase
VLPCPPPHRAPEKILAFSTDAVNHVVEAYCPIIKKHMNDTFTEEQKEWQQIRRGR